MHADGWAANHTGHTRQNNEDSLLCEPQMGLYVVADGMGGHAAGEIASSAAVDVVRRCILSAQPLIQSLTRESADKDWEMLLRVVEDAVQDACRSIFEMAAADATRKGMGTTLTLLLTVGDRGLMAHVGDSRLYLSRGGQIYQLSEDHTFVWQMLQKGKMTPEEARVSPFSHLLTRAIGLQPQVEVDLLTFDLIPGDTFLLCSDGLHDYVAEPVEDLLPFLESNDARTLPDRMVEWALAQGGNDNVTAIVVRVLGEQAPRHREVTLQFTTLQATALLRYITYEEMLRVLNVIEVVEVETGQLVVEDGSEGRELFIILTGQVEVVKEGKVLRELGPGAHFGEMALVDQSPRSATVRAAGPCRLMVLSQEGLYSLMRHEPRVANKILWGIVEVLSTRLRENSNALAGLMIRNDALFRQFEVTLHEIATER